MLTETDSASSDSSQGGDSPIRPPVSKLFTSSPSLSQTNSLNVVIPGHHRRSSSGDKIKVQLCTDLKQQINNKFPRTGWVLSAQVNTREEQVRYPQTGGTRGSNRSGIIRSAGILGRNRSGIIRSTGIVTSGEC